MDFRERLREIVALAYKLFYLRTAHGLIKIENEASMQLQLGLIIKQLGELYLLSKEETFSIELEKWIDLKEATPKSPKKRARCDIWLAFGNKDETVKAAIELKYFKYSQNTEATTDNRFSLLMDLKNVEQYQDDYANLTGYAIVYTNNENYTKSDNETHSTIKLAPLITQSSTRLLTKKKQPVEVSVELRHQYIADWVKFPSPTKKGSGHYFVKIELDKYIAE